MTKTFHTSELGSKGKDRKRLFHSLVFIRGREKSMGHGHLWILFNDSSLGGNMIIEQKQYNL